MARNSKKNDNMMTEPEIKPEDLESTGKLVCETDENIISAFRSYYHPASYREKKDAEDKLYTIFRPYVASIAHSRFGTFLKPNQTEDILQSGWVAFWEAGKFFDATQGTAKTYFYRPVMHGMYSFINRFLMGFSSERARSNERKVTEAIQALKDQGNTSPSVVDIAMMSGISVAAAHKALDGAERRTTMVSLQDESVKQEVADGYSKSPYQIVADDELRSVMGSAIKRMLPNERLYQVIVRKYGVLGYQPQSDTDIHKATGIPTEEIPKLERKALSMLANSRDLYRYYHDGARRDSVQATLNYQSIIEFPDEVGLGIIANINASFGLDMEPVGCAV